MAVEQVQFLGLSARKVDAVTLFVTQAYSGNPALRRSFIKRFRCAGSL